MQTESSSFTEIDDSKNVDNAEKPDSYFPYPDPPITVEELLLRNEFHRKLATSFVFIHDKKESALRLINTVIQIEDTQDKFEFIRLDATEINDAVKRISEQEGSKTFIVEMLGASSTIQIFCNLIIKLPKRNCGVWLLGYVRDLNPRELSNFDALFLFDMATSEFESLRSVIPLHHNTIDLLRRVGQSKVYSEYVLVFISYQRLISAPELDENPKLLYQPTLGAINMDIESLKAILEASKFLFEIGKWMFSTFKSNDSASTTPQEPTIPITADQLEALAEQPKSLDEFIDNSVSRADVDEVRDLMTKLQKQRTLYRQYDNQAVGAPRETVAQLSVTMQELQSSILETKRHFDAALTRVYRKEISSKT